MIRGRNSSAGGLNNNTVRHSLPSSSSSLETNLAYHSRKKAGKKAKAVVPLKRTWVKSFLLHKYDESKQRKRKEQKLQQEERTIYLSQYNHLLRRPTCATLWMKLLPSLGRLLIHYWCMKKSSIGYEVLPPPGVLLLNSVATCSNCALFLCHLATKSFKGPVHLRRF